MQAVEPRRTLFRPGALNARRPGALGEIVLVRPVSFALLSAAAAGAACAIAAFLAWGTYTQHSTLAGRLWPDLGIIKVHSPQAGTIVERHVVEGRAVRRGDLLYVVSGERIGNTLGETHRLIGAELEQRRRSLERQIRQTLTLERTERASLERRVAALRSETRNLRRMTDSQRERLAIAEAAVSRYGRIRAQGFVSEDQLQARREDRIEQRTRLESLEREHSNVERQIADLSGRLDALSLEHAGRRAELERALAATRQETAENEARRLISVTAPADGIATAVVGEVGQSAESGRALAAIVPANATLLAELYAPSRAIGFVAAGDTALVRYEAYPYQKFGHHAATVESVTRVAAPIVELAAAIPPGLPASEAVYRIRLSLPAQTIEAYGREHRLQAGMTVEADVLRETRRLYEWALDPLYTLTRTFRGPRDSPPDALPVP